MSSPDPVPAPAPPSAPASSYKLPEWKAQQTTERMIALYGKPIKHVEPKTPEQQAEEGRFSMLEFMARLQNGGKLPVCERTQADAAAPACRVCHWCYMAARVQERAREHAARTPASFYEREVLGAPN